MRVDHITVNAEILEKMLQFVPHNMAQLDPGYGAGIQIEPHAVRGVNLIYSSDNVTVIARDSEGSFPNVLGAKPVFLLRGDRAHDQRLTSLLQDAAKHRANQINIYPATAVMMVHSEEASAVHAKHTRLVHKNGITQHASYPLWWRNFEAFAANGSLGEQFSINAAMVTKFHQLGHSRVPQQGMVITAAGKDAVVLVAPRRETMMVAHPVLTEVHQRWYPKYQALNGSELDLRQSLKQAEEMKRQIGEISGFNYRRASTGVTPRRSRFKESAHRAAAEAFFRPSFD